jgi:hypothetical protein
MTAAMSLNEVVGPTGEFFVMLRVTNRTEISMNQTASQTTLLAVNDLVSGSHQLYTIFIGVIVIGILIGGGIRAGGAFFGGKIADTAMWAIASIVVAVLVGGGYAIYLSAKHTVDRTGITTGQFGQ